MKKHLLKGFTLVELLIGIGLFAILSTAAYSMLTGSMNASLVGKVQADVNSKAKTAVEAIANDLRTSYTPVYSLYNSSVIFPTTRQIDTTQPDGTNFVPQTVGVPELQGKKYTKKSVDATERIFNNVNQLVFYSHVPDPDSHVPDSDSNLDVGYSIVRYYVTRSNPTDTRVALKRKVYNWQNMHLTDEGYPVGITKDITFDPEAAFAEPMEVGGNNLTAYKNDFNVIEMPMEGDFIVLYVSRAAERYNGGMTIVPNQFYIKVIVGQQARLNDALRGSINFTLHKKYGSDLAAYQDTLEEQLLLDPHNAKRRMLRTAVMDSTVTVPK